MQGERVDLAPHGVAESSVQQSVSRQTRLLAKPVRHDGHAEVTAAGGRTRVPAVAVTLVDDLEVVRLERVAEHLLDVAGALGGPCHQSSSPRTT
jgi:hypothetical protein